MYAERTLGVIDALKKGAPNADIGFLEAKARCQLNKTLQWLASKPEETQAELVNFCIKEGRGVRNARGEEKKKIAEVLFDRQKEKGRVCVIKERNKIGKKVQVVLQKEDCLKSDEFPDIDREQLEKINALLEAVDKPKNSVNMLLDHTKWCKDSLKDVKWKGKVLRLSKNKQTGDVKINISYWKPDSNEKAKDSNVLFSTIIADISIGALILI